MYPITYSFINVNVHISSLNYGDDDEDNED